MKILFGILMTTLICVNEARFNRYEGNDCDPYAYCDGQNFPHEVMLTARGIRCDNAPTPRDRCCLPQAKHLVCYNINVDGQYLNYDNDNYARTTDFTGLCDAMARHQGKSTGKYSSATMEHGGGELIWRHGVWTEVETGSQKIKNLACEIID